MRSRWFARGPAHMTRGDQAACKSGSFGSKSAKACSSSTLRLPSAETYSALPRGLPRTFSPLSSGAFVSSPHVCSESGYARRGGAALFSPALCLSQISVDACVRF